MVSVKDIHKSFKTKKQIKHVLKNISFEANPGRIYGLLGPNGAGKTTTLRLIATLLRPDSGSISVDGSDTVSASRAVRDKIGLLTGEMRLSGNLSPREMLQFFGQLNHMSNTAVTQRIRYLNSYFSMEDYIDRPIDKLSSGMKQKTSLAVSIIHDPQIIIFDEPTSSLDILAVKIVIDFLLQEKQEGKTIILSTHVLSEAEKLCDSIGILLDGELVIDGPVASILDQYATRRLEDVFFTLAKERGVIK